LAIVSPCMSLFGIQSDGRGADVRVAMTGDLDLSTAEQAEEAILDAERQQPPVLILDLSQLEFMDSTGLRVVLSAASRADEDERRLVIVKGPSMVQRVFEITRVAERLEIVDNVDDVQ
jgi:anti-anti-sigma factor